MDLKNATFTAADLADTGQWRLIIMISDRGMTACLRHSQAHVAPPAVLFSTTWIEDGERLLTKIENTVYDNPRILDDYATEIIIQTPKSIFVPTDLLDDPGVEEDYLSAIYPTEAEDIFTDDLKMRQGENAGESCIYTLTQGLPGFLLRTLPGSKIRNHLSVLICKFRHHTSEFPRIYADIRKSEVDLIALDGTGLLSASVQTWESVSDIAYRILLLMKSYGLEEAGTEVRLSGLSGVKGELATMLRKFLGYVVFTPEPATVAGLNIPLPLALALE